MASSSSVCGGIEAGGTKVLCGVARGPDAVDAVTRVPTTSPQETISRIIAFFRQADAPLKAVGVGTFGPVDLNRSAPTYGRILDSPKQEWSGVDLRTPLEEALRVPVVFETDVNAAALGELRWGAGRNAGSVLYLTIGTGVGGGFAIGRSCHHGHIHPEMGHIRVPRVDGDSFSGSCPFHADCLEGLASGTALRERYGTAPERLPSDHEAWSLVAAYVARGLATLTYALSPGRIVLGGGVMNQKHLYAAIRRRLRHCLGGYLSLPPMDEYVVPPQLGDRSGLLGAVSLAQYEVDGAPRETPF